MVFTRPRPKNDDDQRQQEAIDRLITRLATTNERDIPIRLRQLYASGGITGREIVHVMARLRQMPGKANVGWR